jgi:4-hydroxy-3-methylbut-2-enyl diphosphate reductase
VSVKAIAGRCWRSCASRRPGPARSVRLVEVALDGGAAAAYLVDDATEIDDAWLADVTTVGVTSGASAPDSLVQGVLKRLAGHGFDDVEEVSTAEETITFALPRELRLVERAEGLSPGPRTTADRA